MAVVVLVREADMVVAVLVQEVVMEEVVMEAVVMEDMVMEVTVMAAEAMDTEEEAGQVDRMAAGVGDGAGGHGTGL